jgi:hypothetical protein
MAQLNPRALGSLFVSSYDSQSYGGNIRSHRHTGSTPEQRRVLYIISGRPSGKAPSPTVPLLLAYFPCPVQSSTLLLVLASIAILGSKSQRTHDHILLPDGSGSLLDKNL